MKSKLQKPIKQERVYDLEDRTGNFSEEIIELCRKARKDIVTSPIISQLVRSATSIGANYQEANGASSKKDFRNKIFICKKEAKETKYWLRLLSKAENGLRDDCKELSNESQELILIFSKIAANSK